MTMLKGMPLWGCWVRTGKARTLRPVSSSSPLTPDVRLSPHAAQPLEVILHVEHGAAVSIAVAFTDVHLCLPSHQPPLAVHERAACAFAGYFVRHVPLSSILPRRGAFAISPRPGVPSFPGLRLLCPHPTAWRASEFREESLPSDSPPYLHIPGRLSRVRHEDSSGMLSGACGRLPVRALQLPRGDTGEVRLTRVLGGHARNASPRSIPPSIMGSGATS